MAVLTRLVLVAVLVTSATVEGVRLSISPDTIVDGKTPTLTLRCDTDAPSTDSVYVIRIRKPPSTTTLAFVDANGARVDPSIQQRATATGAVRPAAGSSLTLTFTDAITCSDAGDYSCQYNSLNTQNPTSNLTVQATSDPHSIQMMARPNNVNYNVNTTVDLVCSGFMGKPVLGSWIWETRDDAFGSTWTPLRPGLTPVDETPAASGLCQMMGRSTLTFRVQVEDDNRMYRCYFRDSQHSGNFTFNVVGTSTPSVSELPGPDPTTGFIPTPSTSPVTQSQNSSGPCTETSSGPTTERVSRPTTERGSSPTTERGSGPTTEIGSAPTTETSSGLSTGAAVAIAVVLTFLVTLAATLAVVFLLLRHRLMPGPTANNGATQDGHYSGLDLSTREPPRVNNVYDHVGPYAN